MHRFLAAAAMAACLLSGRRAHAQQPSASLASLEFLVGNCWVGTFPGSTVSDTHCFDWVFDRKFIRDRHVVTSAPAYEGETVYAWDPGRKALVFRYIGNQGLLLDGTVEQHGDSLVFPGTYAEADGGRVEIRAVWTRVPDGYHAVQRQRVNGAWTTVMDVTYRRKR